MISQTLFSKFIPYFDYKYIKCYPPVECCSPLPMLSPENKYARTYVHCTMYVVSRTTCTCTYVRCTGSSCDRLDFLCGSLDYFWDSA